MSAEWIVAIGTAVTAVATLGIACGLYFAKRELDQSEHHQQAQFEMRLDDRYQDCLRRMPLDAVLGDDCYDPSNQRMRRAFYDYFELCELQCHYRAEGQVSDRTWGDWSDGIRVNAKKRAFIAAWGDVSASAPEQFERFPREFPEWNASIEQN